jgi:N-acyl-D-aspartate/D-glutamate deacylase
MTAKAADHMDLPLIGRIRRGYYADLVLLDPEEFRDVATYAEPTHSAQGLQMVMVSGQVVYTPDGPTGKFPGRIFRRQLKTQK